MKKNPSRLLSSLLAIAAPAAAPFSPRRAYYHRLRNVVRSCVRVHPFSSMDLSPSHFTCLPLPDKLIGNPTCTETMEWVLDNQDHCYSRIGV